MAKNNEPTPGADGRKPPKAASGKGGLLTVIIVLWLAGLTAFAYMMMNRQEGGELADRVAKLESRTATVAGKITKPGADKGAAAGTAGISPEQLAGLEERLGQLEKKLGETGSSQLSNAAATENPAVKENSPVSADGGFAEMKTRVDDLEARLLACGACSEKPLAQKIEKAPEKKSAPKKVHARRSPRKSKPKKIAKRSAPAAPAAARSVKAPAMENYEHYDSVYDISMRVGPMYGHTDRDAIGYSRMAPGAGIHPSSNPAPDGSFAGNSTYYNQGIFE